MGVRSQRSMSQEFLKFLETEDDELKISMIQHEISVVIKGRSKENLEIYRKVPRIAAGLPLMNETDKGFVWRVYELYRKQLVLGGQFDTDDVALTALSQLSTPIWRRRRSSDGFDAVFVDETHLFNMNELSVFHHLTKSDSTFPIAFAVDRSQAIGDRGWKDDIDIAALIPEVGKAAENRTNLNAIFRSSPEIVNLAFTITSAGANLFTNFDDPMLLAHSNMTYEEEKKAKTPFYIDFPSDADLIGAAFNIADNMKNEISTSRGDIALIAMTDSLFRDLLAFAEKEGKPVEVLKRRGDTDLAARAKSTGRFVLSMPDYVGGLEFDGVVLMGVDEGRVPPASDSNRDESKAYMNFAAHNKLYVAVSRARYQVAILGTKDRGPSPVLRAAFESKALARAS